MTRRPDSTLQSQDGFVLVTVLLFVVLLAALTSASVFLTRQETQTAVANQQYDRAHRLAQRGIEEMVVNWRKYNLHTTARMDCHVTDNGTLDDGTWTGTDLEGGSPHLLPELQRHRHGGEQCGRRPEAGRDDGPTPGANPRRGRRSDHSGLGPDPG